MPQDLQSAWEQAAPVSTPQQEWDAAAPVPALKPSHEPIDYNKLSTALVSSHMTGIPPSLAYQNHDQVKQDFAKRGVDAPLPATIANDFKVGREGSVLGMAARMKMPEHLQNPGKFDEFVSTLGEMVGDLPLYVAGSIGGGVTGSEIPIVGNVAGAAMGTFALPAAMRKAVVDGIQKGDIKSFGDLMQRTADASYAGVKGAAIGLATEAAGAVTFPARAALGLAAPIVEAGLKRAQQAATLEVLGALGEGRTPTAEGFATNAILMTALGLISHGSPMTEARSEQAAMDVYAKDGTTPEETATKLQAQPPVKPEPKPGLQPAIRLTAKDGSTQVITGEHDTHSDLAEATTGSKPVTIDQLEANPKLADRVLERPETHVQQVIDRAYQIKSEAGDEQLPDKSTLKSGRGFVTESGDYLNRSQASHWVRDNELNVYAMWKQVAGDEKAEFHSADYKAAKDRANAIDIAEGEPGVPNELAKFYAGIRPELNDIKAGNESKGYGNSVLRTLLVGPRNMLRAQSEQLAGRLKKLVPDPVDQQAISFMRDYRDDPTALRTEIDDAAKGDNDKLKSYIPAMEKALAPTPQMLEADKQLTDYFTQANALRSKYVGTGSSIDPARYSPRNFMKVEDDQQARGGSGVSSFSKRSPHDIRREYLHALDPLKSGDTEAKTFNALDELRVYGDRLGKSVSNSGFMLELKNSELGKSGAAEDIPASWKELPGTGKAIVVPDKDTGEPTAIHQGFMVPENVAKAVEPILQGDTLSGADAWRIAKMAQGYIKAVELGLSPFHLRAMTLSFVNNAGLDAYREAMVSDNNSPEFEAQERDGVLHGLETTKSQIPREAYRGLDMDTPKSRSELLNKIRDGYEPIDKAFKGITKLTFEVVQRKFKVIDYATRKAAWMADHKQATDAEYGTAMRSIAKEVNAVYGGLNWDVMGVSKNYQAVARMILLAPDWTFSNLAGLKYATFEWGTPAGNASRMFLLKSFITGVALTQGMSMLVNHGQTSKQWDKVYLGNDKKGKEMYSSMFLAGLPKDTVGLFQHNISDGFPAGIVTFGLNKSSPLAGTAARLALNKDWEGKPIRKKGDTFSEKTEKNIGFTAEQLIPAPFVVKDIIKSLVDKDRDITYKDFLAGIIGASVYHETPKKESKSPLKRTKRGYSLKGAR